MLTRPLRNLTGLMLAALAACAPVPQQTTRVEGDDGSLRELEGAPSVVVHEPSPHIGLERAIAAYRALLESRPGADVRVAASRRLADLQLELAEERLATGAASAEAAYRAAIGQYLALLEVVPDYAWADEVRYQVARAYDATGRPERALAMLDRLVTDHPASRFVAEAQFRRGEILFVQGSYHRAEQAYRAVLARGRTAFHEQALYKLGWTLLRQERYADAIGVFFRGLDRTLGDRSVEAGLEALPRAERELVDDTLRAVALAFASMDNTTAVIDYLSDQAPRPYAHLVYGTLGDLYRQRERYFDATELYQNFIESHPMHAEAPRFHIALYELYDRLGLTALAWSAREDFVRRYRPDSEFWRGRTEDALPAVVERLSEVMAELARRAHARWQSSKRTQDMEETIRRYHDFLRFFPDSRRAPDLRFLLAELQYEHGRLESAAQEYERFAYTYPWHRSAADAAYTALLAYQKLIDRGGADDDTAGWRNRMIEGALNYATRFPRHPQVPTVLAKVAGELFERGEHARARATARRLLGRSPPVSPQERRTAWSIVGHVDFDSGDFAGAEGAYRRALAVTPDDGALRAGLAERLAAAVYRQGEQALDAGDEAEAAGHFLRVREVAPGTSIAATAEYDAAAALLRARDWERATQVLERFRDAHADHELAAEATRKLAAAYLQSGRLAPAAAEYERMAGASDDTGRRREALWRAGELYEEAGRTEAAARAYKRYLAEFPRPLERGLEARSRLAHLAEKRGDGSRRRYWLQELIEAERGAGSARSDVTRTVAAEAALALAEPLRDAYEAIPLSVPLEQSLARKKRAMERALEAYGRAAELGVAEVSTAATYHISELYHDFSRALLDSQRPPGLSAQELLEYDVLLEEQAYPFEERAIQLHESNWRRVGEGFYDRWVKASLEQLARLLPARYGKAERRKHVIDRID